MAITLDNVTAALPAGTTSFTVNHVLGAGSNRKLIICVEHEQGSAAAQASVTQIDVDAATNVGTLVVEEIVDTGFINKVEMWEVNEADLPASGSVAVVITTDQDPGGLGVGIISIFGAAQQAAEATGTGTSSAATDVSCNVTTLTDGALIISNVGNGSSGTYTHGAGQQEEWDQNPTSAVHAGTTEIVATAGLQAVSHTASVSANRSVCAAAAFAPFVTPPPQNIYRTQQLTEQSTTSATFVDVPGTNLVFTPDDAADIWMIFVSGTLRSDNVAEVAAEMQLDINGTIHDLWGHQNNDAGIPNGSGFLIFDRITGTVAAQTVKLQFRAAVGTTFATDIRVIAAKVPANADFQYFESDGIVSTTGADVQIGQLQWIPPTIGDYIILGKVSHHETPSGATSQAWFEDINGVPPLHPDAPAGVHHSNARAPWSELTSIWREALPAATQTVNIRFTSSGVGAGASEHRYRKIMAFRVDAWDAVDTSFSFGESTTTAGTFQLKNSLAVGAPPEEQDFLTLQCARVGGDNSTTGQKSGELRAGGAALVRTDHHMNRDNSAAQGTHHIVGVADAQPISGAVTYDNGFLSPDAITVAMAESAIVVLRYAAPGAPVEVQNAPFFGMIA